MYTVGTPIADNSENNTPSVGSEMLTIQQGVCWQREACLPPLGKRGVNRQQ